MSNKAIELCASCSHLAEAYFRAHGTVHTLPVIAKCPVCFNKHLLRLLEEALPYLNPRMDPIDLEHRINEAIVASVMEE